MKGWSVFVACVATAAYAATCTGTPLPDAPAPTATVVAPVARDVVAGQGTHTVDQLLAAAATALKNGHLIAPDGRNVFAYYEAALRKEPKNQIAADALRDLFPYGASAVDQEIKDGQYEPARKGIALLAKANPTNYTLTILRARLNAAQSPTRVSHAYSGHLLAFKATEPSWIGISTADGKRIYSGTLIAGEQRHFHITQPLKVVVGNVEGVTIALDGKPLRPHPGHHGKVARFRVSPPPGAAK